MQTAATKRTATPPPKSKKEEKPAGAPEPEVKAHAEILGLHPQAFAAAVAIPSMLLVFCVAVGPARPYLAAVIGWVVSLWKMVSTPVETFLVKWSGALVTAFTLLAFSPLIIAAAVQCFRAARDLDNQLAGWQKAIVLTIVWTALATLGLFRQRVIFPLVRWAKVCWNSINNPLEKWLIDYADYLVAGCAMICLTPLCLAAIAYVIRAAWNCRVKLVPCAEGADKDKNESKAQ
jgi:hypothetical protein